MTPVLRDRPRRLRAPTSRPSAARIAPADAHARGQGRRLRSRPRARSCRRACARECSGSAPSTCATGAAHVRAAGSRGADLRRGSRSARRRDRGRAASRRLDLGVGDADLLRGRRGRRAHLGAVARVHLKIDTGLHRNGIRPRTGPRSSRTSARARGGRASLEVVGVWSHIAEASDRRGRRGARALRRRRSRSPRQRAARPRCVISPRARPSFARPEFRVRLVRDRRVLLRRALRRAARRAPISASVRSPHSALVRRTSTSTRCASASAPRRTAVRRLPAERIWRRPDGRLRDAPTWIGRDTIVDRVAGTPRRRRGHGVRRRTHGGSSRPHLAEAIDTVGEEILAPSCRRWCRAVYPNGSSLIRRTRCRRAVSSCQLVATSAASLRTCGRGGRRRGARCR